MKTDYEYIVLGLGGFGSAAAYWLARRAGTEVLGLEQFELGHVRGESQDHSRIIRLSYHAPRLCRAGQVRLPAWAELERDSGDQLVLRTGGLDLGPRESAIPLSSYSDSMDAAGVKYERLDAGEIMRRWPQWRLRDDIHGLFQEHSGIAMAARGNAAHVRMAREHGATLRERTPVESIRPNDGEVEVRTEDATYRCRRLVVTAGAWSNRALASVGIELPLRVTKEQVTYFASQQTRRSSSRTGSRSGSGWTIPASMASPCSASRGRRRARTPAARRPPATPGPSIRTEALDRVVRFLEGHLPGALGPIIYTKTCLYTLTPDRDFVLDVLPEHPEIAVAIGGGHGFKFASLIGQILSDLSIDGRSPRDLTPFRVDRPILQLKDPPRNYMV